jgi:hypothetical protein
MLKWNEQKLKGVLSITPNDFHLASTKDEWDEIILYTDSWNLMVNSLSPFFNAKSFSNMLLCLTKEFIV